MTTRIEEKARKRKDDIPSFFSRDSTMAKRREENDLILFFLGFNDGQKMRQRGCKFFSWTSTMIDLEHVKKKMIALCVVIMLVAK